MKGWSPSPLLSTPAMTSLLWGIWEPGWFDFRGYHGVPVAPAPLSLQRIASLLVEEPRQREVKPHHTLKLKFYHRAGETLQDTLSRRYIQTPENNNYWSYVHDGSSQPPRIAMKLSVLAEDFCSSFLYFDVVNSKPSRVTQPISMHINS